MGFLEYIDNMEEEVVTEVTISEARKILGEAREEYLKETKTVFTPDAIDEFIDILSDESNTDLANANIRLSMYDAQDIVEALEQYKESLQFNALNNYNEGVNYGRRDFDTEEQAIEKAQSDLDRYTADYEKAKDSRAGYAHRDDKMYVLAGIRRAQSFLDEIKGE